MIRLTNNLAACAALLAALTGCQVKDASLDATGSPVALPGMSLDPSVPDASTVFAAADAADRAKAARIAATVQKPGPVGKVMTKEEESKSMPMPGQANDHSTPGPKAN